MKVHHVGYLVKNIDKSISNLASLGFNEERKSAFDELRDVKIAFMCKDGYRIELVQPYSRESPMYPLLNRFRNSPYHICYEVSDLYSSITQFEQKGYSIIEDIKAAPCLENRRVVFMIAKDFGITELLEA